MLTQKPLLLGSIGILFALATVQMGQGIWIYLKAELAQFLLERAWARTLQGDGSAAPWPWADTWPVARLVVPDLGVDLIVLAGANGRTLAFGPGHVQGSAGPGQSGSMVLTGHRDTHFRFLSRLAVGDELWLLAPGLGPFRYRVRETQVVDARTARLLDEPGDHALVLITCYPFESVRAGGPLRYVVVAEADGGEPGEKAAPQPVPPPDGQAA